MVSPFHHQENLFSALLFSSKTKWLNELQKNIIIIIFPHIFSTGIGRTIFKNGGEVILEPESNLDT